MPEYKVIDGSEVHVAILSGSSIDELARAADAEFRDVTVAWRRWAEANPGAAGIGAVEDLIRRAANNRNLPSEKRSELRLRATAPKPSCGHCGRVQDGYAAVGNTPLCHPDEGMDCFKLVTLYGHATPCDTCTPVTAPGASEVGR